LEEGFTVYFNRDEFMLLSRQGRVPPAVRAGPPGPRHEIPAAEPWLLQLMAAAVHGALRHARPGAPRPQDAGGSPGSVDRDTYLELEFAVGFAAEDEPWL
jgi:hypothetical protein